MARCLTILVLTAIIIVTPSLSSSQLQSNSKVEYSSAVAGNGNNSQIAVFSADSKPYGLNIR
ncbi:MAG: hypothetical protein ACJ72R_01985 [Nitrososphaeraceae archaeon]